MSDKYLLTNEYPCPICTQLRRIRATTTPGSDVVAFNCPTCGEFAVPIPLAHEILTDESGEKRRLFVKRLQAAKVLLGNSNRCIIEISELN
jgi:ssDNA-binding Zn-finger/Zn-ribbon topoisomerase 1